MTNLTRLEAEARSVLISVTSYDVELDLTRGPDVFGSTSTIRFRSNQPGAETFAEITAPEVRFIELNGRHLNPADVLTGGRIALSGLAEDNMVRVVADCAYSRTGEGLHRFVDPQDGRCYTYAQTFLYEAQRVFACFDQPDLKAPYTLRVTAPADWVVLSNGSGDEVAPGRWEFATTPPLATYFMTVVAGPYFSAHSRHLGTDLGLWCRQSLAEHLPVDEVFATTKACLGYFGEAFALDYPFGKYDQVMVPEFNAGAMENPGCVTFRDEHYVHRSKVTEVEWENLADTIAHEMSHMWFGDLVTMQWWDDLWLNESFAEFMAKRALVSTARFPDAWTTFCATRKGWGYQADQRPTTHPVSGPVPDARSALLNFDGISYAKGASALRQLASWVGEDQFTNGLRRYFREHAYGNTSLADLLTVLERESGRDLRSWSKAWLETAGVSTLRARSKVDRDGAFTAFAVEQDVPAEHPVLRPHRMAVGLYDLRDGQLVRRDRHELDVVGERTEVDSLVGVRVPDLLLLNDDDLTFAKIRLDERSLRTAVDHLGRCPKSLPRALVWAAAWDMTRDAEMTASEFVRLVMSAAAEESVSSVQRRVLAQAVTAADQYAAAGNRASLLAALAGRCLEAATTAEPGSDGQHANARAYVSAARSAHDAVRLRGWLAGDRVPDGLVVDAELRWLILQRLAVLGSVTTAELTEEGRRDRTSRGELARITATAALPNPETKAAAWQAAVADPTLSNFVVEAHAVGFWQPHQEHVLEPYVERYFAELPDVAAHRSQEIVLVLATDLFPSVVVTEDIVQRSTQLLDRADLDPTVRRKVADGRSEVVRALAARAADAAASQ